MNNMVKKFFVIIGFLVLLLFLLLNNYFPIVNVAVPNYSVPDDAIESYEHLRVGYEYERLGHFKEAQAEYARAGVSKNTVVSQNAQQALRRVLQLQNNPIVISRLFIRGISQYVYGIGAGLLILFVIILSIKRLTRRPGYTLLPLIDNTIEKNKSDVSSLIYAELLKISEVHSSKKNYLQLQAVDIPIVVDLSSLPGLNEELLNIVNNLFVGQGQSQIGKAISEIIQSLFRTEYTISGRIFQQQARISILLEVIRSQDNLLVERVFHSLETTNANDESFLSLINDIAYKLIFALSGSQGTQNWRSFQLFTKALDNKNGLFESETEVSTGYAINLLLKALELDPLYLEAEYLLGVLYSNNGQNRDARQVFRKMRQKSKYHYKATYNLGIAYFQEHQNWANQKAKECFQELTSNYSRLLNDQDDRFVLGLSYCGLANVRAQETTGANFDNNWNDIEKLTKKALELVGDIDEVSASVNLALGTALMNSKQFPRAIDKFLLSVQHFPYNVTVHINLAKCFMDEDLDSAEFWLKQALRLQYQQDFIRWQLGMLYERMDCLDLAKQEYALAVNNADAQNRLGEIWAAETDFEQAVQCFSRSIRMNSKHARAWGNLAWWSIQSNQISNALTVPYSQIVEWARRACTLNKGTRFEWLSYDTLGLAYFHNHEFSQSESELIKSISKKNDKIQNRYHLALLYDCQGKIDLAINELRNALQLKDNSFWRDEAQELLVKLTNNQ